MEFLKSKNTSNNMTKPLRKVRVVVKFAYAVNKLNLTLWFLPVIARAVADLFMLDVLGLGLIQKSKNKSKELFKATTSLNLNVKFASFLFLRLSDLLIKKLRWWLYQSPTNLTFSLKASVTSMKIEMKDGFIWFLANRILLFGLEEVMTVRSESLIYQSQESMLKLFWRMATSI